MESFPSVVDLPPSDLVHSPTQPRSQPLEVSTADASNQISPHCPKNGDNTTELMPVVRRRVSKPVSPRQHLSVASCRRSWHSNRRTESLSAAPSHNRHSVHGIEASGHVLHTNISAGSSDMHEETVTTECHGAASLQIDSCLETYLLDRALSDSVKQKIQKFAMVCYTITATVAALASVSQIDIAFYWSFIQVFAAEVISASLQELKERRRLLIENNVSSSEYHAASRVSTAVIDNIFNELHSEAANSIPDCEKLSKRPVSDAVYL